MIILGIDTSCDDTCISVIKSEIRNPKSETKGINFEILSNVVSSQVKVHAKYGGVYPSLAKREHIKNLPLVFRRAVKNTNISKIDLIGVTVGPGLEPCLWAGINFAKDLAKRLKKPLIPVNHIEAHILANFVGENSKFEIGNSKLFPAICLVVSGGHTQLILMKAIGKYKLIGETRDDAAGECFDKTARILGLGYPGGPAIAEIANLHKSIANIRESKLVKIREIKLPRPMIYQKNYDFSFAGLKTAVLYKVKSEKLKVKSCEYKRAMAFEIQQAVIDVLIQKTLKAARDFGVKSIILGGGVASNEELRRQFNSQLTTSNLQLNFLVPPKNLCTDNGAMIALTAFFHQEKATKGWQKIKANANLKIG